MHCFVNCFHASTGNLDKTVKRKGVQALLDPHDHGEGSLAVVFSEMVDRSGERHAESIRV